MINKMLIYVGVGLAVLAAVLLIIFALLRKSGGGDCKADCGNKQCGSDGCGGTCGTCADGVTCGDDGICGGAVGPHGHGDDSTCNPPCAAGSVCVGGHCASSGATCTKPMLAALGGKDRCNYFIKPEGPPMNNNAAAFSCCMSYCGQGCCLWPGCMACGFSTDGTPNKDNVYLLFMNQPKNLAQFFVNVSKIDGTYEAWTKNPGTFPMFSNEVGHDWIINGADSKGGIATVTAPTEQSNDYNADDVGIDPRSKYIVYGTPAAKKNPDSATMTDAMMKAAGDNTYNSGTPGYPTSSTPSKLCGAMKWQAGNGYICGTFDGLGIWKWSKVIDFFCEFSQLTGIQEIGLYDAQFLMPHWFDQDDPDLAAAKAKAANLTVAEGVTPVPTYKGGTAQKTYALKLHLYLGGWPNFAVTGDSKSYDATQQAQGMWTDICLFCKQNNELIKYVYMDTDASGLKIGAGSVQSVPFLTPSKMEELATQLIGAYDGKAAENLVLGAVITANPKYGFLPPKDTQNKEDYLPSSTGSQDQPGGPEDNPSTWTTPSRPSGWDGNNSYCQSTQYPTKDDPPSGPKGCPNSIQNAVFFMSQVNKKLKDANSTNLFTRFIQDGENNGTATAQYCVWWNSILKYMTKIFSADQLKEVKVGQAFSSSTNTGDISKDQKCTGLSQANFVALPELYWYTDYMKNGIGEKKYDPNNANVKALLSLLQGAGHDQAETFLKYGAGCEGCDHNHIAIARQTKKMDNLLTNLDLAQDYDTSGWLKGAAGPSTTGTGQTACITPFNTGKADKDKPYKLANCQKTADNGVFQGHYGCSADCVAGAFGAWLNSDDNKGSGCYFPPNGKYCQDGKGKAETSGDYGEKFCKDQFDEFTKTAYFKGVCPEWQPAWNAAWTSKNVECQAMNNQPGVCQCKLTCNPQGMPPGICADPPPLPIDVPSGI